MRNLIRKLVRKLISRSAGKKKSQKFYKLLNDISLRGMNYGNGDFWTSGELETAKFVFSEIKNNSEKLIVFDIGANVGEYSSEISNYFGANSTIYSFEPSKKTYESLVERTKKITSITTFNFGFSNIDESKTLYSDKTDSVLASVYKRDLTDYGVNLDKSEEIKLKTIDSFCKEQNIKHIHFLKIDVEGHEQNVLEGAKEMIAKNVNFIQFEFGEAVIDSGNYLRNYYNLLSNYDFFRIVEDGIIPIGQYNESLEIFKTVNLFCIRKK